MPLAYFLTWTTYGSWLHGDERGSVDTVHNAFGKPFAAPNRSRLAARVEQLKGEPYTLSDEARDVVRQTIRAHCGIRKWNLFELNVRTNHVHVIVWAPVDPDTVERQFKGWCTRRLREGGIVDQGQEVWTEGGSKRYLWDRDSLDRAREYVRNGQGPDI